tara:strand:- start:1181 stop:1534 length:354 start_codon:yes stop_codon:yes gene_type:complete
LQRSRDYSFSYGLPRLSLDWSLKNGELTRTFPFKTKESSNNFVSAVMVAAREKLEVKPQPPTCRESTYTEYDGVRVGSKDDGSEVTVCLLETHIITPRDIVVGRKIDACYEKWYYKS